MRTEDEQGSVPAEAKARIKNEQDAKFVSVVLMLGGAMGVVVPTILNGEISAVTAMASLGVVMVGGLLRDPKTFKSVVERAIDAVPGGKH